MDPKRTQATRGPAATKTGRAARVGELVIEVQLSDYASAVICNTDISRIVFVSTLLSED